MFQKGSIEEELNRLTVTEQNRNALFDLGVLAEDRTAMDVISKLLEKTL